MERTISKAAEFVLFQTDDPSPDDRSYVHEQIRAFNDAASPHHQAIRGAGSRPLAIWVRDRQGRLRGGLVAETYWGWLYVDDFWLEEGLRRRGHGREILAAAEREALARGCRRAFLKTFSFQARDFYEKCGYRVVGQLEDYPPEETFYWMRKELVSL
jgi:GNAT superfamily N-acetyltransferase